MVNRGRCGLLRLLVHVHVLLLVDIVRASSAARLLQQVVVDLEEVSLRLDNT